MKKLGLWALILIATLFAGRLSADQTYSFTYQACLRDEHGSVITNSSGVVTRSHTVILRMWDKPMNGTLLWGRKYSIYTDETGLFNLEVSDEGGSDIDDKKKYETIEKVFVNNQAGGVYIGIEVEGSAGEIVPRQRLFAVPFAAVANDVRQISGSIVAGGDIKLGSSGNVVIRSSGIEQKTGTSTFQDVTVNGTLKVSGNLTSTAGATINGTLSVKENVEIASGKALKVGGVEMVTVPVGGIIIWTKDTLPDNEHWAICDGSTKNDVKTPDLRARFVVGVNPSASGRSTYRKDDVGGADTVTLTEDQMPSHRHFYVGDDELQNIDSTYDCSTQKCPTDKPYDADSKLRGNSAVYKTSATGGGQSHENRPPYYALYYIMRIK